MKILRKTTRSVYESSCFLTNSHLESSEPDTSGGFVSTLSNLDINLRWQEDRKIGRYKMNIYDWDDMIGTYFFL